MRQVALTVRADALEEALDGLLPLLPQGVHETPASDGAVVLRAYGPGPALTELEAAAGEALVSAEEGEAPDDPEERRLRTLAARPAVAGVVVRPSTVPPSGDDVLDIVIDAPGGAFGSGTHPTTAMCLELLMDLEPGGGFADLGCGTGVLGITAARRGWWPVLAVDHEELAIEAAELNARHNGVGLELLRADLLSLAPPPVRTLAANVPPAVHAHLASALPDDVVHVIASGVSEEAVEGVADAYPGLRTVRTLAQRGWAAALLVRDA